MRHARETHDGLSTKYERKTDTGSVDVLLAVVLPFALIILAAMTDSLPVIGDEPQELCQLLMESDC